MRQIIFIFFLLRFVIFPQSSQSAKITEMLGLVSSGNITSIIKTLENAGGHRSRVTFTSGNDSAAQFIYKSFSAIKGIEVKFDTFFITTATPPYNSKPQLNVVATLKGKIDSTRSYVFGAHYDCSGSRMPGNIWNTQWNTLEVPGADDNATGVAVILEMARILADTTINFQSAYTIRFIAFASEESNPVHSTTHAGSVHYATAAKKRNENILGMFSVDMIGYNNNYHFQSIVSNTKSRWIGSKIVSVNSEYNIGVITNSFPFVSASYSDHQSFNDQNYSAILLIEYAPPWNNGTYYNANPYYHTSYDTSGSLNIPLVSKITKLCLATCGSMVDSGFTTSVENNYQVTGFGISQNFPNPVNPGTKIICNLPENSNVSLELYDITGKKIGNLLNEYLIKGKHTVSIDLSEYVLPSGVYFYRFNAFDGLQNIRYTESKKLLYLK